MKIKAFPRVWVDLRTTEVINSLWKLFSPAMAKGDDRVPSFEQAYAWFIGTSEAVSFPSCRSALYHSLAALEFEHGSEVILPAFTFWVDVAVVELSGLKPVFVDVERDTLNINPTGIEAVITPKTKCILLAHLNGLPCDMDKIMDIARRHNLRVIEDSARSCGARFKGQRVGSFDIGAFSFGYGKSFYGFGGGMVTSDDTEFIKRLRKLKSTFQQISTKDLFRLTLKGCLLKFLNTPRIHWFSLFPLVYRYQIRGDTRFNSWFKIKKPIYDSVPEAYKMKMYNLQAKLGFRQIKTIDSTNSVRKMHLATLDRELAGIPGLLLPPAPTDRDHVCVHYVVWTEQKEALQKYLMEYNIDAQDESAEDVTQMKRFQSDVQGEFPNARKLNGKLIYLPAHPCLSEKDMRYIAARVKDFVRLEGKD